MLQFLSILLNLLVASITILLCFFFLFVVVFNIFFTSPVDNENERLRLAFAIPTGIPITIPNNAIEMLLFMNFLISFGICSTPKLSNYVTVSKFVKGWG